MDNIQMPGPGSKVLVFAPHNDDEVLGAGDLINKTLENKGQVKVVLITNGDGFKHAIELDYLNPNPKTKDYIRFGYTRQKETIQALKNLGLAEKDIIFLGYPDGGIASLWNLNWDSNNPYRSKYTQAFKSPYYNSMTKNVSYTGQSMIHDIVKIVAEYQPTHIVLPHPNDKHPDHWATNAFVKYALTQMNYKPQKEWLYLVHRGDWPTPMRKDTRMYLTPPAKLIGTDTTWYALDMDNSDINLKTKAINSYKTQFRALGMLLTAFERKNELFGEYPNIKIARLLNEDADIAPDNTNRVITDPIKDTLRLEISREADITGIYVEISNKGNLHIFIQTDATIEKLTKYHLNLVFLNNGYTQRLNLEIEGNQISNKSISNESISKMTGIETKTNGKYLHIVIPYQIPGSYNHLFINAQSLVEEYMLDKTAWRMCDI